MARLVNVATTLRRHQATNVAITTTMVFYRTTTPIYAVAISLLKATMLTMHVLVNNALVTVNVDTNISRLRLGRSELAHWASHIVVRALGGGVPT